MTVVGRKTPSTLNDHYHTPTPVGELFPAHHQPVFGLDLPAMSPEEESESLSSGVPRRPDTIVMDWCLVSESRVEPAAAVPGFDPVADRQTGFGPGSEPSPIDEFFLQSGEERFGGGVVPTHSGTTHRLQDAVTFAEFGVLV